MHRLVVAVVEYFILIPPSARTRTGRCNVLDWDVGLVLMDVLSRIWHTLACWGIAFGALWAGTWVSSLSFE